MDSIISWILDRIDWLLILLGLGELWDQNRKMKWILTKNYLLLTNDLLDVMKLIFSLAKLTLFDAIKLYLVQP